MAGELSIKWANIKKLDTTKNMAVITKNVKLTRHDALAEVPQGTLAATDKTITLAAPAGPKDVPVGDTSLVLSDADFRQAVDRKTPLWKGWGGTATGGAGSVRSTQNATTYNAAINLVRAMPPVAWLPASSRTTLDYNQTYGTTTQPGIDTIKTNIYHADGERDQYFTPRVYVYGNAAFDHNFSQSLQLQQAYGGGIGMTVLKSAKQQLDIKADVHYEKQAFFDPSTNQNLIGSTFAETYLRHLPKGITFNEFGSASPAWNNTDAYSAHVNGGFVFPVYKGLGFNVTFVDDYLNNAPVGSNKNSTQLNVGISYTIKPKY
jgi:hypothetical protein